MTAADTNLLVRLLTQDDPAQGRKAKALFASEDVWISKTVLLETEWVLRSAYGLDRANVLAALRNVVAVPRVRTEASEDVQEALRLAGLGLDFADALHLASIPPECDFSTFDVPLRKRAAKIPGAPRVRQP